MKKVKLLDVTLNKDNLLSESIARLVDEGYTVQFRPGGRELSPNQDELWLPIQITILLDDQEIAKGKGLILDEVMTDVYSSTPERTSGEGE